MVGISPRVGLLRRVLGLSRKAFAQQFDIPLDMLKGIENGDAEVSAEQLGAICQRLPIFTHWLLTGAARPALEEPEPRPAREAWLGRRETLLLAGFRRCSQEEQDLLFEACKYFETGIPSPEEEPDTLEAPPHQRGNLRAIRGTPPLIPVYDPPRRCSFCGRPEEDVQGLVDGPEKIEICGQCIVDCLDLLMASNQGDLDKDKLARDVEAIVGKGRGER